MFEVVGQENAKKVFENACKNERLAHAYLLYGPKGTQKSTYAMYMASKIMCKGDEKPCGQCEACRKIISNSHPDVRVVSTEKNSIGIDVIRKLLEEINTKPYEGDKKVIVIIDADKITVQGQNSILKTLEEPPADTTIIMTAENINLILNTIKSRCQTLKFQPVKVSQIEDYLVNKGIDKEKSAFAAAQSGGIVEEAEKFLDDDYIKLRKEVLNIASKCTKKDTFEVIKYVDFFVDNQDKSDVIFAIMKSYFRDIIVVKLTNTSQPIINYDCYDILVEESGRLSYNKLSTIMDAINIAEERIKQYANFRLAVEVMILDIQEL